MDTQVYKKNLKLLAEMTRKANICVVTATQIEPANNSRRSFNRNIPESNIIIIDYIDIIGEK